MRPKTSLGPTVTQQDKAMARLAYNPAIRSDRDDKAKASLDFFPTPPWATRALLQIVLGIDPENALSAYDPACGEMHMVRVLTEHFAAVGASDIHDYGCGGEVRDYLTYDIAPKSWDWVITNPPFNLATKFILKSLDICRIGVAMLVRTQFIAGQRRYTNLFKEHPPAVVAQFAERVPMLEGRLEADASTMTDYCWIIWRRNIRTSTRLMWIPLCRARLEKAVDYSPRGLKTEKKSVRLSRRVEGFKLDVVKGKPQRRKSG